MPEPEVVEIVAESEIISLLLGAIAVGIWSFWNFPEPNGYNDLRFATRRARYYLGVFVYCFIGIVLYVLAWASVYGVSWAVEGFLVRHGVNTFGSDELRAWAALIAAVLCTMFLPTFPPTGALIAAVRRAIQEHLAFFPHGLRRLLIVISRARLRPSDEAENQLADEFARYGVTRPTFAILSPSSRRLLIEMCSMRNCFLHAKGQRPFLKFFSRARASEWDGVELNYRRILRRASRGLVFAEAEVDNHAASIAISNFVIEESEELLGRYRKLLAEVALSSLPTWSLRERLIKSFGYEVQLPKGISIAPLVIVFIAEFAVFMVPVFVKITPVQLPLATSVAFALSRAIAQILAIIWALYPKSVSNFARPSLYSLPSRSYLLFGLASYATAVAVTFVLWQAIDPPFNRTPAQLAILALFNGLFFLVTTVMVSLLTDLRLRRRTYDFTGNRTRDGIALAFTMAISMLAFSALVYITIGRPPGVSASDHLTSVWRFAVMLGVEGFFVGFFLPSVAATHLDPDCTLDDDRQPVMSPAQQMS
jgi:hypothetical protein